MQFNGKLRQQEKLSKEDVQLLRKAIYHLQNTDIAYNTSECAFFLAKKLERMEKAFRS